MFEVEIPDALHICPGCHALAAGSELCVRCTQYLAWVAAAQLHAQRAAQLFGGQQRSTRGVTARHGSPIVEIGAWLLCAGIAGALASMTWWWGHR